MTKMTLLLFVLVVVSSLLVVTIRHENRLAFIDLQQMESQKDHLKNEWGRLMLEKATWADQHSIADDAGERLGMQPPSPDKIVTVQLQGNN